MPRPTDRACLVLPGPDGQPERRRWWYLEQPRPSVAFSLQTRIAGTLGGAAGFALESFYADPDQAEDFAADRQTVGEALALQTLRRARAGKALFNGADMAPCTDRLWAVLHVAVGRGGERLDSLLLAGEAERERRSPDYKWTRPSLLHRLLMDSALRFDGTGPQPLANPPAILGKDADPEMRARVALREAVAEGGVTGFVRALDDVLAGPDELALLSAWAVLHLWRPF